MLTCESLNNHPTNYCAFEIATSLSSDTPIPLYFDAGRKQILLDHVMCNGSEATLLDCENNGLGVVTGTPGLIVGVIC